MKTLSDFKSWLFNEIKSLEEKYPQLKFNLIWDGKPEWSSAEVTLFIHSNVVGGLAPWYVTEKMISDPYTLGYIKTFWSRTLDKEIRRFFNYI